MSGVFARSHLILTDSHYDISLKVMDRKLGGIKDSLVQSAIWRANFTEALKKYPDFELSETGDHVEGCEACNLEGRVSTQLSKVCGTPYDKESFGVRPILSLKGQMTETSLPA